MNVNQDSGMQLRGPPLSQLERVFDLCIGGVEEIVNSRFLDCKGRNYIILRVQYSEAETRVWFM